MKKLIFLLIGALLLAVVNNGFALEVPPLKGYVNDYAQMLSAEEGAQITADLDSYEKATSTQIFILTIPSLEGQVLEAFSIKVAEAWKAGQKSKDNGIIILLVKNDRKVRIEVGQGLEGSVTDLTSGRIIREDMIPLLREGKTAQALQAAIDKTKLAVKGEYKGDGTSANSRRSGVTTGPASGNLDTTMLGIACVVFLVVAGIASAINYLLGGVVGAIVAPLLGIFMFHFALSTLLILAVIGFVLGMGAFQLGIIAMQIGFGGRGGGFGGGGGGGFGGGGASGDW